MKKTPAFILSLCILLPLGASQAFAQQKVGFVNPQRILNESRIGQAAQGDLAKLGQEKDRLIRDSAKEINGLKKRLAAGGMSQSEEQALTAKLQALYERHDRLIAESNEDITYEEARLIHFIMKKADESLRAVAKKGGFSIVLTDPDIIGYIDDSSDLTDEVIKALNAIE